MYSIFSFIYGLNLTKKIKQYKFADEFIEDGEGIQTKYSGTGDYPYWVGKIYHDIDITEHDMPTWPSIQILKQDYVQEKTLALNYLSSTIEELKAMTPNKNFSQENINNTIQELEEIKTYIENTSPEKAIVHSTS